MKRSRAYSISLIFPMFNEKDYLEITTKKAISVLSSLSNDFEIIVVDDGSYDGSEKLVDKLAKSSVKIKVFHHWRNLGLGETLKTGFSQASKDIIVYTDIDMPFDLLLLEKMLFHLKEFDIVHGYCIKEKESIIRRIYSGIYNLLIRSLFDLRLRDIQFASLIFKRKILENLDLSSSSSFIKTEFLLRSHWKGHKIKQVSVKYLPRQYGISKFTSLKSAFQILFELFVFWSKHHKQQN